MRRAILTALAALLLVGAVPATAWAAWADKNCKGTSQGKGGIERETARAYAAVAVGEGYEWGGGCWNDDNLDNTPGKPNSRGEGPDCSGLVFKSWYLRESGSGFIRWSRLKEIHGPYGSWHFAYPQSGQPFYRLPNDLYTTTMYMDAFAKDGHIGLILTDEKTGKKQDQILEAYTDASGVKIQLQDYRWQDGVYFAVRRVAMPSFTQCPQCADYTAILP
jgi:hypothetical protein